MSEAITGKKYAEAEMKYFPQHWDEQTKNQVQFMITEAFNSGHSNGYDLGNRIGKGIAVTLLHDMIEKLVEENE